LVAAAEDPTTSEAEGDDLNVVFIQLPTDAAGSGADADTTAECKVLGRLSGSGLGEGYVRCLRWKPMYDADDEDDEDEDDGSEDGGAGASATEAGAAAPTSRYLVTVASDCVAVWEVAVTGSEELAVSSSLVGSWAPPASARALSASFDPTAPCRVVIAAGSALYSWDVRDTAAPRLAVRAPHGTDRVLDVSCNGNKPWHCASAGEDGCVRLWDIRPASTDGPSASVSSGPGDESGSDALDGPTAALLCLQGHSHWCTAVRFNPYHDQLLLSAGTDGGVCLWSAISASSAPLNEDDDDDDDDDEEDKAAASARSPKPATSKSAERSSAADASDTIVRRWGVHADSISASSVDWGCGSAWVLATASVEGRVGFREVPKDTKYKILLR
jgi:WD40 repeat protein